jgi:hypothetical protein
MPDSHGSDAGDRNRPNLGRLVNEIGAWVWLAVGSVITIATVAAALLVALLVSWHSKSIGPALGFIGVFLLIGLILALSGLTSVRRLRRQGNVPAGVSQFANAGLWNAKASLPPATATPDEKVVDWMGPMMMAGRGFGTSATITLGKETDRNPFNTLLVTRSQLIGILLTPDDLSGVESGQVRGAITTMVNQSTEATISKNLQFEAVNRSRWDQLVASATSQGLQACLAGHLNFGLAYTDVQSFSVSHGWINPGLVFKLRDGRKMKCCGTGKQIDQVAESLFQYLTKA